MTTPDLRTLWNLDPETHHLNHGSFGAVPVAVQTVQDEWRRRWEANPTSFIHTEYQPALDQARNQVAQFVGADPEGFGFVRNTTSGIAGIVRSWESHLEPGDEILTTSQTYNAVRQTLEFSARRLGVSIVAVEVPLLLEDPEEVVRSVVGGITDRTRLAVIDHISSPTGQDFPIADIVGRLEPDIPVIVDGAHAPGQVDLNIGALNASWYVANLHKWVCAPKGAGLIATRSDRVADTFPTVISHAWPMPPGPGRYRALFDWLGTDDPTPWLAAPEAIRVIGSSVPGGWSEVRHRNRELVLAGRDLILERLGVKTPYPDSMVGSMASIPLPNSTTAPTNAMSPMTFDLIEAGFEVPVLFWPGHPNQVARISAHLYNNISEYEALADTLGRLLADRS